MNSRNARIDYLRVAAIVLILLHHADDYTVNYLRPTPTLALLDDVLTWAALATLFALSGFLTFKSSASDSASGWMHLRRRFARLYIPFAAALVLIKLLDAFPVEWSTVLVNLALLGPWVGPNVGTLWFVEILLYFHALYAIWLSVRRLRIRPWSIPAHLAAITLVMVLIGWRLGLDVDSRIALYLPAFAGSACLGATLRFSDDHSHWMRSIAAGAATVVVACGAVALAPAWTDMTLLGLGVSVLTTVLVGVTVLLPERTRSAASPAAGWAHQIAFGSYMAYLVHRPVFRLAASAAAPFGEIWVSVAVATCIPIVLGAGVLLQRWYDHLAFPRRIAGTTRA